MSKLIERGFFSSAIKLSDITQGMPASVDPDVQILRVGSFQHPKYGEFEITSTILAEMKANFDKNIRGIDIALDYFHESDQAASGWLKELTLREDSNELWGRVDWTPKARKMLAEREIRYFSPDFAFEWTDPETNVTYNNVLFGGGLTNRPFVKDMAAIVAAENSEDEMKLEELEKKVLKLAEDLGDLPAKHEALQKAHSELQAQHGALQKKLEEMGEKPPVAPAPPAAAPAPAPAAPDEDEPKTLEEAHKKLADQKAKLAEYAENAKKAEDAKQLAEKESKFTLLLTEGKACVAQKEAFLKGDMENFIKLAEKVNVKGSGHGGGSNDTSIEDKADKILKLAEEKCKADPKLDLHVAISLAQKEVK